jgi:hypothetical protein
MKGGGGGEHRIGRPRVRALALLLLLGMGVVACGPGARLQPTATERPAPTRGASATPMPPATPIATATPSPPPLPTLVAGEGGSIAEMFEVQLREFLNAGGDAGALRASLAGLTLTDSEGTVWRS